MRQKELEQRRTALSKPKWGGDNQAAHFYPKPFRCHLIWINPDCSSAYVDVTMSHKYKYLDKLLPFVQVIRSLWTTIPTIDLFCLFLSG